MTGPRRAAVATGLVALALGACTAHVHYPLESRGALPVSRTPPLPMFEYPPSPAGVRLSGPEGRVQGYTTRRLSMPASFESGQPGNRITGTFYASDAAGRKPLAIVLPVWGISEYPSTKMTRVILKHSDGAVNVLRINGENRLMPWKRIQRSRTRAAFEGLDPTDYPRRVDPRSVLLLDAARDDCIPARSARPYAPS